VTVKELREQLAHMPDDATVLYRGGPWDGDDQVVDNVVIDENDQVLLRNEDAR
jgi:hypothetical protein